MNSVYRGLTAAELQEQYDVEAAVPDLPSIMDEYSRRSDAVRQSADSWAEFSYGGDPLQKLDVFAPEGAADLPIHIYIHGGYWRGGSRLGRAFPATVFNEVGAIWIPIDYRLLPDVDLDDIVADVRSAVAWTYGHALEFGGDRDRIHLSGSSAGGHLTAMTLLDGWHRQFELPEDVVKTGCAISGLFDLEPLRHTSENDTLCLDGGLIARNSPILHNPVGGSPLTVAWGGRESDEFKRQSQEFATAWSSAECPAEPLELVGHDHFTAIGELANPDGPLLRRIFTQMGLGSVP